MLHLWCRVGGGGVGSLSWKQSPLPTSPCHAPGNKVYQTGRTAGLHGRSNCHLLSCTLWTVSTKIKLKKKNLLCIPALYLAGKTARSFGMGVTAAPSVFCDPRWKGGCVSVCSEGRCMLFTTAENASTDWHENQDVL